MSRFHEEFFRAGSLAHDKLMIECTSEPSLQKIMESIDIEPHILKLISLVTRYYDRTVTICPLTNGTKTAWRGEYQYYNQENLAPHIHESFEKIGGKYQNLRKCSLSDKCEHKNFCCLINKKEPYSKDLVFKPNKWETRKEFETEVIARNGTFIIGYADAIIKTTHSGTIDATIEEDWIWKDFTSYSVDVDILIEAKPKLTSIGEVIRQLKTYKSILKRSIEYSIPMIPVIVTYSQLEKDAITYLKNEDIQVVVFEEMS